MVTSKNEINIQDLKDETDTRVKMQITYGNKKASVEDADWDIQMDYCYVYIFNLIEKTFTMTYMENLEYVGK